MRGRGPDRRGATLVEALIALAISGLISTGVVAVFVPLNQLSTRVARTGAVQENARSALGLVSDELRHVTEGGVMAASADSIVVRMPVALGAFCATGGSKLTAYLPPAGPDIPIQDVEGIAIGDTLGQWSYMTMSGSTLFGMATTGAARCIALGGGEAGSGADYYTWDESANILPGTPLLVWVRRAYRLGPSLLDPTSRALYVGAPGAAVEIARDFAPESRFEYRRSGSTTWTTSVTSGGLSSIEAVRVVAWMNADGPDEAPLRMQREVRFFNAR